MTLLIYSTETDDAEQRLRRVIELLLPEKKLKFYRSINDLSCELRQPVFKQRIVIIMTSSRDELEDILSIRQLLEDTKIILIAPDANANTLARGHTLRPRFLSTCNSDFVDIAAVLAKMIRNLGR